MNQPIFIANTGVSIVSIIISIIGIFILIFWTYAVYPIGLFVGMMLFVLFMYAAYKANIMLTEYIDVVQCDT